MFRYMIDCFQYTRELTRHCILASPHFTSSHFTSLPPCISPASNGLCTCIIASHCDAKTTCNRISSRTIAWTSNLVATHSLSLPSTQPTHFHPPPISTQISLTTTAKASLHYHPLSSLDSTPLSRTADGYQPLQLPPHCTHHHRPGCARLLLLRPALHPPIRYEGGTRGKERAPSFTREISHRNLTLHHSLERLFAPSFCPYGCSNLLLNPGSHQRRIPLLLHLHRSQQGRPTLRSQTASQGQQAAQDLTEHNSGRSDLVTSPDLTDPLDDIASPSNQQPHSWQLIASTISV